MMWAECVRTCTMLENNVRDKPEEKSPIEKYGGKVSKWVQELSEIEVHPVLKIN